MAFATGGVGAAAVVSTALVTTAPVVSTIKKNAAINNKEHNKKNAEPTSYIYGQAKYSNWRFGVSTLDQNGCGIIATYNVLRKFGKSPNLTNIIYDFDVRSGSLAVGYFGADPTHISEYLRLNGLKCTSYNTFSSLQTAMSNMKNGQMVVICAWNSDDPSTGAHYFAVEKITGGYKTYNRSNNDTSYKTFPKIDKTVTGGDLIVAFVVS